MKVTDDNFLQSVIDGKTTPIPDQVIRIAAELLDRLNGDVVLRGKEAAAYEAARGGKVTPDTLTVAQLVSYFEKHCECRPIDVSRTSHSHDCDDDCCNDVWLALCGMPYGTDYRATSETENQTNAARQRICDDVNAEAKT